MVPFHPAVLSHTTARLYPFGTTIGSSQKSNTSLYTPFDAMSFATPVPFAVTSSVDHQHCSWVCTVPPSVPAVFQVKPLGPDRLGFRQHWINAGFVTALMVVPPVMAEDPDCTWTRAMVPECVAFWALIKWIRST